MARTKKEKEKKTTKKEEQALTRQLTDFIYREYEVTYLPNYFFINLAKIYKGEYKNLREPISCEDLFDMWQKKIGELKRTYEYNKEHGKDMYGVQRVSYDLAILLNKYDSYKRWKEKQSAIHEQEQQFKEQYAHINAMRRKQQSTFKPKTDEIDINEMLNDI